MSDSVNIISIVYGAYLLEILNILPLRELFNIYSSSRLDPDIVLESLFFLYFY
jgi:hypothetical protein